MKQINQDIKTGQLKQIYLIYGEEAYLREQFAKRLILAIAGEDSMNISFFKGKNIEINEVIAMADTLPFFSSHRLLVIEDSGWFKKDSKEFADYLENLPSTTYLLFRESEVDKRNRLYKKVKDLGYAAEMKTQTERELELWILSLLKSKNVQITSGNMQYFLHYVGNDMNLLRNEVDKLTSYLGERTVIERKDIEAICSVQLTGHIFDMIDAMSRHNQKQAMQLYYDLVQLKEPPMRILFLIIRQYMQFYQLKELMEQKMRGKELASAAGLSPYIANKVCKKAETFTLKELKHCMDRCISMDEGIKTGLIKDQIAIEMLIVELSE